MADTGSSTSASSIPEAPIETTTVPRRIDRIQPGTSVDEMRQHVMDAMELLEILDQENPAIAQISDGVKAKLASIPSIAAPESEDETKIIDALFLGIMSVKELLKRNGVTTQYDSQITSWETALNNPRYKRDFTTVLKLKDLLRNVEEKI